MTPDQERRLEELFDAACALSPEARAAFLDRACAGDAALRQEVESLLAAHEQAGDYLLHPAAIGARAAQKTGLMSTLSEVAGKRIGRYKLLEQIGEGGFGVVWMAEQEEPVRRRVALKIIKLGMDTKEVVARFEAERQALAMMDHPNIASVFDGGATDTGRPYFVMELVKGVPITDYCDANKLSTRGRLELFMQVCHAVQHAHQKGVIHRDLKPSNILVTVKDDRPVPKVIDFGVAKATQARLTEKTLFTRLNQWIGTPAYMSPEQAGLGSLDVDTRSDVYSLGVLLYELLMGRTPFDTQKLLEAGYEAVMRTIREEEPPKPSRRLSTLADEELCAVAAQRGAEPAKLGRLLRGDLDWIVMKALQKDRSRRYETASALGRDLDRHLRHEPVSAAAPTLGYRLSKFIRRRWTTMVRTAAAFLVGGFVMTVLFWLVSGRGPRWFPDIRPGPRVVNTPPYLEFEHGLSDVYVQNYGVIGSGLRLVGDGRYMFIRTKEGPGGWRAFDSRTRERANTHPQSLAYVVASNGSKVFELALEPQGLLCRRFPDGNAVKVTPSPTANEQLGMLISAPRTVRGLVICASPSGAVLFAFDPETGHLAWTNRAVDRIEGVDARIRNLTADDEVVVAGLWGSRIWVVDAASGQHCWSRTAGRDENAVCAFVAGSRVFGFTAGEQGFAFDKQTGRELWQRHIGRADDPECAVFWGTNVIVQPRGGVVLALTQAEGRELWRTPLLSDHSGGGLAVSGDFVACATGCILQRIDPGSGVPGAYLELPTLKKTVLLYGKETPVFVSHPIWVALPDWVYAFTVDGSLWCAHLPAISTNLARPSAEATRRSLDPMSDQLTNRPTPPLPNDLKAWREQLEHEGRGNLWTVLEKTIDASWLEAQEYARIYGGIPHVVIGRVVVPRSEDPRLVLAQMKILEGGYFATAVKDLQRPLSFRLPGCLPVDHPLKERTGDLAFLGNIVIPAASPTQVGAICGQLRSADGLQPKSARVTAAIEAGAINHPSNGSEPRPSYPDPVSGRISAGGAFSVAGLSPAEHRIMVAAPGYLPVTRLVFVVPGATNDLGVVVLDRPLTAQVSWFAADKPGFQSATHRSGAVGAGQAFPFKADDSGSDLRLQQQAGRLNFKSHYVSTRMADLGERPLDPQYSNDVGFLTFAEPAGEVQAGHVYLFQQASGEYTSWVLFRVDRIDDGHTTPPGPASRVTAEPPDSDDPLLANVHAEVQRLRSRLQKQTRGLDKLYSLLEPYLGQLEELAAREKQVQAEAARVLERGIPPRDIRAGERLLNLQSNYNGAFAANWHGDQQDNNLQELPAGLQRFDGVEFDVRGLVQAPALELDGAAGCITNIVVRQVCRRLHFLHAAINAGELRDHTEVGRYVVRYADGQKVEIPLHLGVELADWWHQPGHTQPLAPEAWKGTNGKTRQAEGCHIRLFHLAWNNPRPDARIETIDLVTTHKDGRPFLVGLTTE